MAGSATGKAFAAARAPVGPRRAGFRLRISGWGRLLLRRLGVYRAEPRDGPPDWDDAEQW